MFDRALNTSLTFLGLVFVKYFYHISLDSRNIGKIQHAFEDIQEYPKISVQRCLL